MSCFDIRIDEAFSKQTRLNRIEIAVDCRTEIGGISYLFGYRVSLPISLAVLLMYLLPYCSTWRSRQIVGDHVRSYVVEAAGVAFQRFLRRNMVDVQAPLLNATAKIIVGPNLQRIDRLLGQYHIQLWHARIIREGQDNVLPSDVVAGRINLNLAIDLFGIG